MYLVCFYIGQSKGLKAKALQGHRQVWDFLVALCFERGKNVKVSRPVWFKVPDGHCVARFHVGHAPGVTRVGFAHRDLAGVGHGGTQELGLPVQRYLVTNRGQVNQGITIKHYLGESLIRRSIKTTYVLIQIQLDHADNRERETMLLDACVHI